MNDKMFLLFTDIFRDVGDRHYSEVQRHPGGRVSTKVILVKCQCQSSVGDSCQVLVILVKCQQKCYSCEAGDLMIE